MCEVDVFWHYIILMQHKTLYLVPPDILDYPTSTDMVVQEGSNVSLRCVAAGSPEPSILWKREDGEPIFLESGEGS